MIKIGLTIGDPSGIGPAIALKAIQQLNGFARFTVIGNSFVLKKSCPAKKFQLPGADLVDIDNINKNKFSFGRIKAEYGKASIEYLDQALALLRCGKIDCLVTCPVSKEAVNLSGKKFSGHTKYLSSACDCPDTVMLLLNDRLKFCLLSQHLALKNVAGYLNKQIIENTVYQSALGLKKLFRIAHPRFVFCGLNPHASDNGVIGREEPELIIPAIKSLKKKLKKTSICGPFSADIAIAQAVSGKFDCVVAAYHDQALIALKLTGPESGVNLTLGLPFVRTSPLHGTAIDIAGNWKLSDPSSLIAAIKLAVKCTRNLKKA
ncbi:MAG: 4-hydroxythreonine-4-phosphate dehydrogenase PdxA [Candidatus Omnitrophica bacterium]|jgi:4-hydroxythreonine-4-phosphate dehydrogenase|nr:4-hydroxythreonine-4-phosphate dehydrogenase PdxA [Candidatus Omnitrophota bacterium]